MSTDRRVAKQNAVFIKFNPEKEILTQATAWVKLEDITLSKISQTHKDKHGVIRPQCSMQRITFIDTESGLVVARAVGRGNVVLVFNGYGCSVSGNGKLLERDSGDDSTAM